MAAHHLEDVESENRRPLAVALISQLRSRGRSSNSSSTDVRARDVQPHTHQIDANAEFMCGVLDGVAKIRNTVRGFIRDQERRSHSSSLGFGNDFSGGSLYGKSEKSTGKSKVNAPALARTEPAVVAFTTLVAATAVSELLERLIGYGPEPMLPLWEWQDVQELLRETLEPTNHRLLGTTIGRFACVGSPHSATNRHKRGLPTCPVGAWVERVQAEWQEAIKMLPERGGYAGRWGCLWRPGAVAAMPVDCPLRHFLRLWALSIPGLQTPLPQRISRKLDRSHFLLAHGPPGLAVPGFDAGLYNLRIAMVIADGLHQPLGLRGKAIRLQGFVAIILTGVGAKSANDVQTAAKIPELSMTSLTQGFFKVWSII